MQELTVPSGGASLAVVEAGEGIPVLLLHGLTATRRYVVMGSQALERSGHRTISYDARGHGRSSPAPDPGGYGYGELSADLNAVLDRLEIERAVIVGASMGAHTGIRIALDRPTRIGALVLITPAHDPATADDGQRLARWHALADGLRAGGVEGFMSAYGVPGVPERWREPVLAAVRQRLSEHQHPEAVADALCAVPRSHPFESVEDLRGIEPPTLVVASHDEADPDHPYAIAEAYAQTIPNSRLVSEEPGASPLAWQGAQLSRRIAELAAQARREGRLP